MASLKKEDGGGAFPQLELVEVYRDDRYVPQWVQAGGMSIRDYFAAHAPVEPWDGWHPVMPPQPEPVYDHDHSKCPYVGSDFNCSPSNWAARDQWYADERQQRQRQWPYAYADLMLAERAK